MKLRTKLIATIMSMCLVIAFGVLGIFAAQRVELSIGGNINFEATGINAVVSNATGNGLIIPEGAMQGFTLTTAQEPQIDTQEAFESWENVTLAFVEGSEGVASLSFDIENTADADDIGDYIKVELIVNAPTEDDSAIAVTVSDIAYVKAGAENKTTCTITFTVANPEVDAEIDFSVTVKMTMATEDDIPVQG